MVNKHLKPIIYCVALLVAFVAGGWFFSRVPYGQNAHDEVAQLYSKDGQSLGIFDNVPEEDMAAAARIAEEGLRTEVVLPEDKVRTIHDGRGLPSQVMLTDMEDIAGVAPKESDEPLANPDIPTKTLSELNLTGNEVASVAPITLPAISSDEETSITMIAAPVRYFVIRNTEEYKEFKRRARGSYPEVDFKKQMVVVLESDSNLPDNVFELVSAEEKDGELVVSYRVNVFRLDKKINSHTVLPVNNTKADIALKQVL